jgi:hypothetical protein
MYVYAIALEAADITVLMVGPLGWLLNAISKCQTYAERMRTHRISIRHLFVLKPTPYIPQTSKAQR